MAANTDKLKKLARRWVGQIGSAGVSDASVTTIPLSSTTNLPNDTAVPLVIDRVSANGTATPALEETIVGVVSGSNIINAIRGVEGTAQAHSAGAVVEVLWTANNWNDAVDWGLVEHNQDGTHKDTLVTSDWGLVEHNQDGTHKDTLVTSLKATGAEINTGTEDAKIVTPKAIADSKVSLSDKTETLTNKTLTSPTLQGNLDGWIAATDTWTYASATTFTIAGLDRTAMFPKGTKIKLTQTTDKYFYVVDSAYSTNTTITVTGGSDYSLANASITSPKYSYAGTPQGFPQIFNFTPSLVNMTLGSGTLSFRFRIEGRMCYVSGTFTLGSDSAVASIASFGSMPVASAYVRTLGLAWYSDDSDTNKRLFGTCSIEGASSTNLLLTYDGGVGSHAEYSVLTETVPFTWASGDIIAVCVEYLF